MIDLKLLEEFSRKLSSAIPPALAGWQTDVEKNGRVLMDSLLRRMDLVTREEYEVQATLLARTRDRLAAMEARVLALEAMASSVAATEK